VIVYAAVAVWGAVTLLLLLTTLHYGYRVRNAEQGRMNAEIVSAQCVADRTKIEEEFTRIKEVYAQMQNRPVQAVLTEEQIDSIAKYLGARLLPYTSTLGLKQ
jgi:hypothetical protein